MKTFYFSIVLSLFAFVLSAQTPKIDSLTNLLKDKTDENEQLDIKLQLANEYYSIDPTKALEIGKECHIKAAKLGDKLRLTKAMLVESSVLVQAGYFDSVRVYILPEAKKYSLELDYAKGLGQIYNLLGGIHLFTGQYDSALVNFNRSIELSNQIGDSLGAAKTLMNIASIYTMRSEFEKSLECGLKAKAILEKTNDVEIIAKVYNNIAINFQSWGNLDKALEYYLLSIEKSSNKILLSSTSSNIGEIYKDKKQYAKAIEYYSKAKEIVDKLDGNNAKAIVYLSIGETYNLMGNYSKGYSFSNEALEMFKAMNHTEGIARGYTSIGKSYEGTKQYSKAIECISKSNILAKQVGIPDLILSNYNSLAQLYRATNQPNLAFDNLLLYSQLKDSVYTNEKAKLFTEMQTKYETQKKEQQIKVQAAIIEKNKAKQRDLVILLISGFAVIIFIIILYLQKRKSNIEITEQRDIILEKNTILQQQNEEIICQTESLAQANKEITHQKDEIEKHHVQLTDSLHYAIQIQTLMLPSRKTISKVFPEHFIIFRPCNIVSGDFYYMKQVNGYSYLAAADCTGHGVPGALMSMLGVTLLNEVVVSNGFTHANQILDELRKRVKGMLHQTGRVGEQKDGMDISLCVINSQTNEMSFAAAHNPLWIVRKDSSQKVSVIELEADNQPVGVSPKEKPFSEKNFKLEKEDTLFLFSDGFYTQFDEKRLKKFQLPQLKELIVSNQSLSLEEQAKVFETRFDTWKGNMEQTDDVLLLAIKI